MKDDLGFAGKLATASFTYQEVGATRDGSFPPGYGRVCRDVLLGHGREVYDRAVDGLFDWRMHRAAGFTFLGNVLEAAPGVVIVMRFGWWPVRLTIPCRVVYVIGEPDRAGFAYGTLPGHPECGEESFVVSIVDQGEVHFRICAFSRPVSVMAKIGGPITRMAQERVTDRYANALKAIASSSPT